MNLLRILTILFVLFTQGFTSSNENYYKKKLFKEQMVVSEIPAISTIQIFQCKSEIDRLIFHCSKSKNQIKKIEKYSNIEEMTRDECLTIHSNQTLLTQFGLIEGIGLNSTTRLYKFVAGNINSNTCQGAMFDNGTFEWSNVAVQINFTLNIQDFTTIVANSKDLISINNILYKYSPLQCTNSSQFQNFWFENRHLYYENSKVTTIQSIGPLATIEKFLYSILKYLAPIALLLPVFLWLCKHGTIILFN